MPAPADSVLPRYSDAEGMARVRAKEAATQERWRRVREQVDAQKERERRREEEERQASSRDSEWISTDADMSRGSSAQGLAPPARLAGDVPLSINEIIRRGSEGLRIAPRGCVGADSPASPSTLQRSPRLDLRAAAAGAAADVPATYAASSHALGRDLPHTPRSARVPVRSINDIINGIPLPPAALRSDASAANQSDATPRLRTISAAASDDGTLSDASESSVDSVGREVRETLRASQLINPQTRTHRSLLKDRRDAAASPTLELPDTHRLHHATSFPTRPARNQTPSPQLGASEFGALQKPPVYARKSAPGSANASVRNRTLSNISVASANARLASSQTPRSAEAAPPVPSLSASEDASVSSFIRSSKLTRVVTLSRAPYAGLRVSLADVGDPVGHPVVVFLGLGAVRYLVGLYDEMAAAMGLRLICVDRWGMGRTDDLPSERRGVLLWSGVVHEVADELGLSRFSVLAHSAGAPYAMATCLTSSPGTIAGPAHLLAPWVGAEVESGYKWLKYVPDGIIKTAQAAEWRMQGWKLGKLPTLQTDTPPLGTAASRKGRGSQEPSSSDPPMSPHDASQNAADVSLDAALKTPTLNVPSPVLSSTRPLKQKSSKTGLFGGIFGATNGPQSPRRSPTPSTPATPALPDASALSSPRQTAAPSAFASIAARSEMPTWESSSSLAGSAGAARLDTSPAASRDARPSLDGVPKLTARRSLRVLKRSASGVDVTAAASVPADPSQGSKVTRRSSVMGPADGARGSSAGSTALSSPAALSFPAFQDGSGPSTPTHAASSSSSASSATTRGGSSGPASDLPTALLRASHAESLAGGTADLLTILGRSSQRPWGFSYPDVRHPVLVWHGDRDERISLASAQWMEREMADCTVRVVKGAGHGLMTNIDVVVSALER
jgi:pimeloyl-ACP methyl ester carboxylesterase